MPINFPSSPSNNQVYVSPQTNKSYTYSTVYSAWIASSGSGGGGSTPGGSNTNVQFNNNGTLAGSNNLTFNGTVLFANSIQDAAGAIRDIPINTQSSPYTLTTLDVGRAISTSNNSVTVPAAIFLSGDTVSIYNNSSATMNITQGTSTTIYFAGTSATGNRALSQRGLCSILCVAANTFVISGAGLS
jgi:hypothetical protein